MHPRARAASVYAGSEPSQQITTTGRVGQRYRRPLTETARRSMDGKQGLLETRICPFHLCHTPLREDRISAMSLTLSLFRMYRGVALHCLLLCVGISIAAPTTPPSVCIALPFSCSAKVFHQTMLRIFLIVNILATDRNIPIFSPFFYKNICVC